ncbi:glycosyl transferase [Luteimonas chenhongjianii]|uniref:Glycosyl transferase n=2 Tax=Luteimonas chenhongjianii TaxID=2006110 RepID=A0A290XAZ8_9GAMM|nr:glycosyl transferase [Luteimonas chenhongjianii]
MIMATLAILLPDLGPGGAERMRLQMAAIWLRRGFAVEFVLLRRAGELIQELPEGASLVDLGAPRIRSAFVPLTRYLRGRRPQALLAAMWPLTVLAPLAARAVRFRGRVAISEHSPLSLAYAGRGRVHRAVLRGSTRFAYPWADARIGVSAGVADGLAALSGLPRSDFRVVHNPAAGMRAPTGLLQRPRVLGEPGRVVLTVGTLKKVKRHDLLLRAFARLAEPDLTLCILGEGEERPRLEALVRDLRLHGRVSMPGYVADPSAWYAHADLFVLASDYEGFGNVIVEAMEYGVPIVSTDCPAGPSEILEGGKYGTLTPVGDPEALAAAMQAALRGTHDRSALKARARDFSVEKIADEYLDLLLPDWRAGRPA